MNSLHVGEALKLAEHLGQAHGRMSAHQSPHEENLILHARLHENKEES